MANTFSSVNELDDTTIGFDLRLAPLRRLSLSLAGPVIRGVHAPWAFHEFFIHPRCPFQFAVPCCGSAYH
ncbi:hypothetical protein PAXINDRAFT_170280 [Paxillus involutus ATCC 200175]|uniref:Uncharacterized protein n=1 Tax=Paxillus involutus ATCC 200175 TaxID=664439 RepID=A0A0C9TDT8_PAXIN|nr:hypothetical protein PAXINDRAFT_170280 [Paxillus involutus ATCC 200175]